MKIFILVLLSLYVCSTVRAQQTHSYDGARFTETFEVDPQNPVPWSSEVWSKVVHLRSRDHYYQTFEMEADHGPDCGPPPATHTITDYQDAVYNCKNHLMTSINAPGYGVIYLTPAYLADFSQGEAVIQFEMSTLRKSGRDWVDIWLTPFEDHLQLPLNDFWPDLQGEPRRSITFRMDAQRNDSKFHGSVIANHEAIDLNATAEGWQGYESFLEQDARRRDLFEIRISKTHIKFGMPEYDFWWYDTEIPELDWDKAVVQLGHHSYNPTKDCDDGTCGPATWHWDNVSIEPAQPVTFIQAQQRYADPTSNQIVIFAQPAPLDAWLRFSAIGSNLEISVDGGTTWMPALKQAQEIENEGHFSSYFMPIPEGTASIMLKGSDWWGGYWHARDFSIWSLEEGTSVATEQNDVPDQMRFELYPNPAVTHSRLRFTSPSVSPYQVTVHDLLGREKNILKGGVFGKGYNEVMLDVSTLSPGVYYLHVDSKVFSRTIPLVVVE